MKNRDIEVLVLVLLRRFLNGMTYEEEKSNSGKGQTWSFRFFLFSFFPLSFSIEIPVFIIFVSKLGYFLQLIWIETIIF